MKLCLTMLDLYCWCKLYCHLQAPHARLRFLNRFRSHMCTEIFCKTKVLQILFLIFIIFISVDKILVTCAYGERILLCPFHIQFVSFQSFPSTVLGSGSVSDIDTVWDIGNTVCPCLRHHLSPEVFLLRLTRFPSPPITISCSLSSIFHDIVFVMHVTLTFAWITWV